ncbi:MAG: hypothetical protein JWR89_814, partial [Tardiphaga sp.]|uniref:SIR2 family protein n=1 Tax=Tardiphaga sp. TaxID=1926292 RepID=UPI002639F166
MRFFADGPNIPDELLESRDDGNVVFFCGAGISLSAGLPSFIDLADQVVEELGAPPDAKVRKTLARAKEEPDGAVSLDQIFSMLEQEYRQSQVNVIVHKLLETSPSAKTDQHSIVLRLSINASRQPQIVTTNFDLLFERAQNGLQKHISPALPDISSGQPLTGLVYLHGRLNAQESREGVPQQLILSSSDFGRAYLADAWATRFVRDLLKNYVIVLLGYSANDPPIRYLLEGLHAKADVSSKRIFAFDQGTETEVADRWRDRGVIPLAYPRSDAKHSALWKSLNAWAYRADDPEKWRNSIVALASSNPRKLTPHERGQVSSIVRTTVGAKLFSDAAEAPPAEWICVFDHNARYGEPREATRYGVGIDPLFSYGLDDDPPREQKPKAASTHLGIDVLSTSPFDERRDEYNRLAGVSDRAANPISPRLFYISRWLGKVLQQPAALWWAAGYHSLHNRLVDQLEWRLDQDNSSIDPELGRVWRLLLHKFSNGFERQNQQYRVISKIKR